MRPLLFGIILSTVIIEPALACGSGTNGTHGPLIPALAAVLDDLWPDAQLGVCRAQRSPDIARR